MEIVVAKELRHLTDVKNKFPSLRRIQVSTEYLTFAAQHRPLVKKIDSPLGELAATLQLLSEWGPQVRDDSQKPSEPFSAYTFFSAERRPQISRKYGGTPFGDVNYQIAAEWKHLLQSERDKYHALSEMDQKRYLAETFAHYFPGF